MSDVEPVGSLLPRARRPSTLRPARHRTPDGDGTLLADLLASAWSLRRPAVAGLGLGALVAVAALVFLPTTYVATAQVLLKANSADVANPLRGRLFNGVNVDTVANLAVSHDTVRHIARALGVDPSSFQTKVTGMADTSVLALYVTSDKPVTTEAVVRRLAEDLLDARSQDLGIPKSEAGTILRYSKPAVSDPDPRIWILNGSALGLLMCCVIDRYATATRSRPRRP